MYYCNMGLVLQQQYVYTLCLYNNVNKKKYNKTGIYYNFIKYIYKKNLKLILTHN